MDDDGKIEFPRDVQGFDERLLLDVQRCFAMSVETTFPNGDKKRVLTKLQGGVMELGEFGFEFGWFVRKVPGVKLQAEILMNPLHLAGRDGEDTVRSPSNVGVNIREGM